MQATAPALWQAAIATAGDAAFFRLARRLGGEGLAYAWVGRVAHTGDPAAAFHVRNVHVDAPVFELDRGGAVQHRAAVLALDARGGGTGEPARV